MIYFSDPVTRVLGSSIGQQGEVECVASMIKMIALDQQLAMDKLPGQKASATISCHLSGFFLSMLPSLVTGLYETCG